jgi:hypothetical protein
MESPYPQVEGMLSPTDFPVLNEIFHRHPAYDFASGGIWVSAEEAVPALAELFHLLSNLPADLQPADAYFLECLQTLLAINGQWIRAPEDQRFDFVIRVATGDVPDLDDIAHHLCAWSHHEG